MQTVSTKDHTTHTDNITINIRKVRLKKQYSQEYMAMRMGISQNAYSKIELKNCKLTVLSLMSIAEILEVSILELITDHHSTPVYHLMKPTA